MCVPGAHLFQSVSASHLYTGLLWGHGTSVKTQAPVKPSRKEKLVNTHRTGEERAACAKAILTFSSFSSTSFYKLNYV